jgi:DNA-binding HxlR family transcriptional regulator
VSVLGVVGDAAEAKRRIADTFSDARTVIIYRGVQHRMNQPQIVAALKERELPQAQQQRVSDTLRELEDAMFVRRNQAGYERHEGWDEFGLERTLRKTLRDAKVADLAGPQS